MPTFKYVLSTIGVSKESISKFLIGNRFHVKLRNLSPYSNRIFFFNKDWGCVILREIDFQLKICWSIPCLHPSWKVHTWIKICASLNQRKKTKAAGSRLIPRKHTETLVLLSMPTLWCFILPFHDALPSKHETQMGFSNFYKSPFVSCVFEHSV